jgi:hypothetical protein
MPPTGEVVAGGETSVQSETHQASRTLIGQYVGA